MQRIRKIKDIRNPANEQAVAEVEAILRAQFPGMSEAEFTKLPSQLRDPLTHQFVTELVVSEDHKGNVKGFAILLYVSDLNFAYLETISAAPGGTGRGVGATLYEIIRDDAAELGAKGIYFECLPDEPSLSPDAKIRKQNAARLKFYERYGATPIIGTAYEMPVSPDTTDSPYLVFDGLDRYPLPPAKDLQEIMRAVLERKYGDVCPPEYIDKVVASVKAGKFSLRERRYTPNSATATAAAPAAKSAAADKPKLAVKVPLIFNDRHIIHHIRERGYVEAPVRVEAILRELRKTELFEEKPAKSYSDRWIREVHDGELVAYLKRACEEAPEKRSVYPYVFPVRNPNRKPKERSVLSGYWCIDTFTPINRNAYPAARQAVDCSLTAADEVLDGKPLAYALVRPPGHHAEHRTFGGFCYFCNAAIAAHYLSRHGKVAILDIDYHHGNGQQDIFYQRADVLTVSVHGNPSFAYPYFTGFRDERGLGRGAGFNVNIPLAESVTPAEYLAAVEQGLKRIAQYEPKFLVLSLGYDTGKGDPTGTWNNMAADFAKLGRTIGLAGLPTVVVQEGGYRVRTLGINARNFFEGLCEGLATTKPPPRKRPAALPKNGPPALSWSETAMRELLAPLKRIVTGTNVFSAAEVDIAVELLNERIEKGRASTYEFIFAHADAKLVGYSCYGKTPATQNSVDLYWIVVGADAQGRGIGRELMRRTEEAIGRIGGRRVYIDTSSTDKYAPTRAFYRKCGFKKLAELPDFYKPGDGKLILVKDIAA